MSADLTLSQRLRVHAAIHSDTNGRIEIVCTAQEALFLARALEARTDYAEARETAEDAIKTARMAIAEAKLARDRAMAAEARAWSGLLVAAAVYTAISIFFPGASQ